MATMRDIEARRVTYGKGENGRREKIAGDVVFRGQMEQDLTVADFAAGVQNGSLELSVTNQAPPAKKGGKTKPNPAE